MSDFEKLAMQSPNLTAENVQKVGELFPEVMTEARDEHGRLKQAIDFNKLKQVLSEDMVDGKESYEFTWVGKREAMMEAGRPTTKTLRPDRESSVNFDTTENIYIEGDNLEALKILQESYLGKIKMIYIDPPYNTGNDFVYNDSFNMTEAEVNEETGAVDELGNRFKKNESSGAKYHSNWLNMMYPRLKLARNLLREDGVIFISIDDYEVDNLRKICDEVFSEENFVAILPTIMNLKGNNDQFAFAGTHEYTLVYSKSITSFIPNQFILDDEQSEKWEEDGVGFYKKGANLKATGANAPREKRPNLFFPIYIEQGGQVHFESGEGRVKVLPITNGQEMSWRWSMEKMKSEPFNLIVSGTDENISLYKKQRPSLGEVPSAKPKSIFYKPEYSSGNGTSEQKNLFGGRIFSNPKPLSLIKDFLQIGTNKDDIILDFFSGSATIAHSMFKLNLEDKGNRKFIAVQLIENTDLDSEAFRLGYKSIPEIGKERIRRAGKKIIEENAGVAGQLDIGFKVFKIDESNMKDIYYKPSEIGQGQLFDLVDNVKDDRSSEDLLYQVMLSLGLELSLKVEKQLIDGVEIFNVADSSLIACFADNLNDNAIRAIAKMEPLRAVFKESSFANSSAKINLKEIFKELSAGTKVKVI